MRQKYLKGIMIVAVTIVFGSLVTGCMEKDVYNPDAGNSLYLIRMNILVLKHVVM